MRECNRQVPGRIVPNKRGMLACDLERVGATGWAMATVSSSSKESAVLSDSKPMSPNNKLGSMVPWGGGLAMVEREGGAGEGPAEVVGSGRVEV